ncbi:acetoin dehydrogenase dihydrolipoyllysine-residue acetyltransferase subunit [Meridianimarinicoccus sp. RP-17]|uniref:acetoin dehydrogenase dihydrolipoyllysine-residue acetyltransferase subunit n=1 Tax=Meridianimarinicoccus zhengii TaxID=2056810 RepID=UPI000DACC7D9|nr:acetoin dehydrogenase dihydrolipoyllysine-residue acetyltransferase subunit [Phycocomes zhengii]
MPVEVIMPKVDMDMDRGRIVAWHVAEGTQVAKGDPLFDIETDKAAMEVEAQAAGILHHRAAEGTEVPIGKPVAWLYAADEAVGPSPAEIGASEAPAPGNAGSGAPGEDGRASAHAADDAGRRDARGGPLHPDRGAHAPLARAGAAPQEQADALAPRAGDSDPECGDRPRATPAARARARDAGIDLAGIAGSGPRGRVQRADIDALLTTATPAQPQRSGSLAVSRRGGGSGLPVVLLHGFGSDMTSWTPLEPHLGDRPLIRIDLPGHGRSAPDAMPDFAALAAAVRAAFDDLGLARAHLVGHSLGGALALALADTRPRQIAALTLIAPAGLGPQVNGPALAGICRATRADSLAPWLRTLVADPRRITDSYARLAMDARADPALRAAQTALADAIFPDGTQGFDLTAALDRLVPPARIVWGKADAIIPWQHALRAPGRVGLHLFDHIGHMPQIECPEEVGKIVGQPL